MATKKKTKAPTLKSLAEDVKYLQAIMNARFDIARRDIRALEERVITLEHIPPKKPWYLRKVF